MPTFPQQVEKPTDQINLEDINIDSHNAKKTPNINPIPKTEIENKKASTTPDISKIINFKTQEELSNFFEKMKPEVFEGVQKEIAKTLQSGSKEAIKLFLNITKLSGIKKNPNKLYAGVQDITIQNNLLQIKKKSETYDENSSYAKAITLSEENGNIVFAIMNTKDETYTGNLQTITDRFKNIEQTSTPEEIQIDLTIPQNIAEKNI